MPTMTKTIANALDVTATAIQAGVALNTSPFNGGQNKNAWLRLEAALGGAAVVKIQGNPAPNGAADTAPVSGDAGWADIVTLNASSHLKQEIVLPSWIRTNVTTLGTGTATIYLEGIQ